MDRILNFLAVYDMGYHLPSELDFSASRGNPLDLIDNEKNQLFIDQYFKLDELRAALEEILTHGDKQLEKKHKDVRAAITRALCRLKEHRRKLYTEFMAAAEKRAALALDDLSHAIRDRTRRFEYPLELDFPARMGDSLSLLNTERNRLFIDQLCWLDRFWNELKSIPTYGNERLKRKHKNTSATIRQARHALDEHQRQLQERHIKLYRPYLM
ncbi:hypothetical protein RSOL_374750 [Rhizoctonia solani AG-3 Rhs1AP]|uniref:Uncharacterized protein n=1 Tax=Rhizoctonia solani AG-3 Rhs1AP TaxID=1086054 RepID=X8JA64_9AGAM|nr:hypothetical protein RSOL_374750 [Rhizoctonia solani AG-3 Rhs1AP]